ncbi:glycoside hydrolase family 28 protein, partial [Gonapodya prolifera JEL478]
DVVVTNITCSGSHGLSVGSLAKNPGATDTVRDIVVKGATMIDSTKAAGFKLYPGGSSHGTAIVQNVTWSDVMVQNCGYAFQYTACYNEQVIYCTAKPSPAQVTDINLVNFSGTTSTAHAPTTAEVLCPVAGSNCQI